MRFLKSQEAARAAAAVSEGDASAERLGRIMGRCKSQQTLYPQPVKIEQGAARSAATGSGVLES
jgi:hypothetical protein